MLCYVDMMELFVFCKWHWWHDGQNWIFPRYCKPKT